MQQSGTVGTLTHLEDRIFTDVDGAFLRHAEDLFESLQFDSQFLFDSMEIVDSS